MKFLILLLMVNIFSCQNDEFSSKGNWVGTFNVHHRLYTNGDDGDPRLIQRVNGYIIDTIDIFKVLSFENDTVTIASFNETLYYGYDERNWAFYHVSDSIYIEYDGEKVPLGYSYINDRFVLHAEGDGGSKYDLHFVPVKNYNMAGKIDELRNFLLGSPITLDGGKNKFEFLPEHWLHMAEFVKDSMELDYEISGNDWYLYKLRKELFLIIGHKIIHIKEIDDESIYGQTYNKDGSEILIQKSEYNKKFATEYLNGSWISTNSDDDRVITIKDDSINISEKNDSKTMEWKINKYQNKMLLNSYNEYKYGQFWKIISLSKSELVIKKILLNENKEQHFEILKFIKK